MVCGLAIENCSSEWFQSAFAATNSPTASSPFTGNLAARSVLEEKHVLSAQAAEPVILLPAES
jgi:hypothetical protein